MGTGRVDAPRGFKECMVFGGRGGPGPELAQWQLLLVGCIVVPLSLRAQGYSGAVELFSSKCCQCLLQSRLLGTVMAPVLWLILIAPFLCSSLYLES